MVVPLYTDDRPENIAYILNKAGVKLLLLQKPLLKLKPPLKAQPKPQKKQSPKRQNRLPKLAPI